eukprot:scaffold6161_cov72-Phaeocystis_antarctica.AAC.5
MRWMRWSERTPWTSKMRDRCCASIVAPEPVLLSCKLTPRGTRRGAPFSSTVSPSERVKLALPLAGMEARSAPLDEAVTRSGRQNNILLRAEAAVPVRSGHPIQPSATRLFIQLCRSPSSRGGGRAVEEEQQRQRSKQTCLITTAFATAYNDLYKTLLGAFN